MGEVEADRAAALDGASAWTTFARITLPQLRAVSVAVLLLATVNAFQAFDEFYGVMATAQVAMSS